jgi:PST family polysaccharide transporter
MVSRSEERPLFERAASALGWRFVVESGKLALQTAVMVALARLLPVDAFGVLTLAMIVLNLAQQMPGLGTGTALVQNPQISPLRVRVAFTLSLLTGAIITSLIWAGAPLAAHLFRTSAITPVLRLLSFVFFFTSLGATPAALLERQLDYRKLLKVELVSYGLGFGAVSMTLALLNYGVWALAWATVTAAGLRTFLLFAASPHSLRPSLHSSEARQLLNFGLGTSLTRLANYAAFNGDYFIVGRYLGPLALGLYSRAYQVMTLPMYQFSMVLVSVLFPTYAQLQSDRKRLRRAYLSSLALSALVVFPLLSSMAIVSPELMTGVFGSNWAPAGVPLQILCIGGIFQCMYKPADCLARAMGVVYAQFWCHVTYILCVVLGCLFSLQWNITGVSIAVVGALAVVYLLLASLSLRLLEMTWWTGFFLPQLPGAILGVAIAAIALPATLLLRSTTLPPLAICACGLLISLTVAVVVAATLPRALLDREALSACLAIIRQYQSALKSQAKRVLHYNKRAYKFVEIIYENGQYLPHIIRNRPGGLRPGGLWRRATRLPLARLGQQRQAATVWQVAFPSCQKPEELITWLRNLGVTVVEGGHTFYLPPQEALSKIIPSVVAFYPPTCGFKILRDFRRPEQARYLRQDYRHVPMLMNMIGSPGEQIRTANYLYSKKIGPRIWDLACWHAIEQEYTVFVLDHVQGNDPTSDQCQTFLDNLKSILSTSPLRVLIPQWEHNMDFLPPGCNGNLIYSSALASSRYVDFQNFGLSDRDAWSQEVLARGGSMFQADLNASNHAGNSLYQSIPSLGLPGHRNTATRWACLLDALRTADLGVQGRLVLDVGCNAGMILHQALAEGAAWAIGWDRPDIIEHAKDLLLSMGLTRFSLRAANIGPNYSLSHDIPLHCAAHLRESVIFYLSVRRDIGLLESLRSMSWRALVYEGEETESVASARDALRPLLATGAEIVVALRVSAEESRDRPLVVLKRE